MPTAENAKLEYEAGQNASAMGALTDSGNATLFTSGVAPWSGRSGYTPVVRPDGLVTGGVVTPAAAAGDDTVDVAALTAYVQGVLKTVSAATDQSITRPAGNVAKVNSITVTSAGAVAVVAGTDGATATFSETRGAAGGPPYIPVTSVEIAQVRVTTSAAAPITADQVFAVVGVHQERFDYPLYDIKMEDGDVEFYAALPLIHTGDLPKNVYASYAEPIFAQVSLASEFVPPETSHNVSSTQIYGTTLGSTSKSLSQGGFTAYLQDGVTDPLVGLKDELLWFKFSPDRYKSPYVLCQGYLGISRSFPAGNSIQAACTISASQTASEYAA